MSRPSEEETTVVRAPGTATAKNGRHQKATTSKKGAAKETTGAKRWSR